METLLSLGPQFALPVTSVHQAPIYHLLADVECILKTNSDTEIGIANLITNYIHHIKHGQTHADPLDKFLNHAERVTKNFVKANSDVLIVPSDKGNKTVLIQADDYRRKMLDMPKAHKEGLPLRPVVPNMTAPSYNLPKYVGQIIQKSIYSPYNIKDSFSFCHFINEVELPPNYVLISLDVKSLFTSIPIPLIQHDIIMRWNKIMPHTIINLDLFLELVNFCHILNVFNSYDVHIQFTHELEVNNKLPFLDMLLVRQDNQRIKTEWYMKPIASGRFLDFLSYHPMSMKLNVAKNFISRVYRLSTNQSDEENAIIIDNQLRLNHYPAHLRHRLINRMTEHRQSPSITSADEDQQQQTPPVRQDTAPSKQSARSNQQH
ncbi:uncharacterized protein LOC135705469 [Ochlerotatus camptorhynchus]|uniref:uncharacterized protein LOC135705469 n=1 Tax=Ochlerotatus camptorhynchus TaxID=644619 RepID=UPI0031E0C95C